MTFEREIHYGILSIQKKKEQGIDSFSSFHGDRNSKSKPDMVAKFLSGGSTEVDLYNEALEFFGHLRKRMEEELKKRGF